MFETKDDFGQRDDSKGKDFDCQKDEDEDEMRDFYGKVSHNLGQNIWNKEYGLFHWFSILVTLILPPLYPQNNVGSRTGQILFETTL